MKFRLLLSGALPANALGLLALGVVAPLTWVGCSDPPPPTPRAAIYSNLTNGAHTAAQCMIGGGTDWVDIGKIAQNRGVNDPVLPVDNGGSSAGQGVGVECAVTASGDNLQVNARATLTGVGIVNVNGVFAKAPADGSPIPPQMNVEGLFQRNDFGQFSSKTCVMTFPRAEMGIAPGRIWGQLDCSDVANTSQMRTCEAHAEVRFENCAQ